jgi:hypothetical protein
VTDTAGGTISKSVTVTVGPALPAPRITSFTATPSIVGPGERATLAAVLKNGVGTVDQDIGPAIGTITSGVAVNLGVVGVKTKYVLTVKNLAGDNAFATTTLLISRFRLTGSLLTPRYSHTATLLQSGKVLISADYTPAGSTTSCELYDPVSGTFSPTGSMLVNRASFFTATRLASGKVLIVGSPPINGFPAPEPVPAEVYDPSTGTFS